MDHMIELRNMKWEDVQSAILLERHPSNSSYVFQWTEAQYERALQDEDYRIFALTYDDFLIGHAILCGFNGESESIELKRIVVQMKGRGIGRCIVKKLMHYVFEICGKKRMWLDYFETNEVGRKLYTDMGFVEEGRLRKAVKVNGNYLDLIIMGILEEEYEMWLMHDKTDDSMIKTGELNCKG